MAMKVDATHPEYEIAEDWWTSCRDTYAGEHAVKKATTRYLPKLGSHKETIGGENRYRMYLQRASFYNAVGRTVDGLAGAALRTDPQIDIPKNVEEIAKDVTLLGDSLEGSAGLSAREILKVGRQGILVDVAVDRPYWTFWDAEDIVNWRTKVIDGEPILTMVVLREKESKPKPDDFFVVEAEETYRVLLLVDGKYTTTIWRKNDRNDWSPGPTEVPLRRGRPLPFIPFTFLGPTSIRPSIEKPPLLDLVSVNLSWYRNSADLEHGLHFVGVPQIVIMGAPSTGGDAMEFGSSVVWVLDQGADAKILQADGETLGALERALERKQRAMASLGARMLEDQNTSTDETATAVLSRSSGEHATLGTISNALELGYRRAIQISSWWAPGDVSKSPADIKAEIELSKDFSTVRMDAQTLTAWVNALQAEAISYKTFWAALTRGQVARPVDSKVELREIEKDSDGPFKKPEPPPTIPGQAPPVPPNPADETQPPPPPKPASPAKE